MNKDLYRETGTIFKRSPLVSPTGGGFAAKVRAVVADHARQLQGMMSQAKRGQGLYRNGMAGKKRTWLPGGVLVETWINPFGLVPTIMARVSWVGSKIQEIVSTLFNGWFTYALEWDGTKLDDRLYLFGRDGDEYGPNERVEQLEDGFVPATSPCTVLIPVAKSVHANRGAYYTGRMRYVVQLLQGVGKPIPYNYQWCDSYGIVVSSIGVWWVVRITRYGVWAWPLPIEKGLSADDLERIGGKIGFVPGEDPATGGIELLSEADMEPFYGAATPYYVNHGWAFAYDAPEAQAIKINVVDLYWQVTRWKLSFAEDENNALESATLEQIEESYAWAPSGSVFPKYPQITNFGPCLESKFPSAEINPTPPAGSLTPPLDVFYLPTGEVVLPRSVGYGDAGTTSPETSQWPPQVSGDGWVCGGATQCPLTFDAAGTYVDAGTVIITRTSVVETGLPSEPMAPEEWRYIDWDSTWDVSFSNGPAQIIFTDSNGNRGIAQNIIGTIVHGTGGSKQSVIYGHGFVKSMGDREAFDVVEYKEDRRKTEKKYEYTFGAAAGSMKVYIYYQNLGPGGAAVPCWYKYPGTCGTWTSVEIDDLRYCLTAGAITQQDPVTIDWSYCDGELVPQQVIPFFPSGETAYHSGCSAKLISDQVEHVEESFIKVHVFSSSIGWKTLDIGAYSSFNGWLQKISDCSTGLQQHFIAIDVFGNAAALQGTLGGELPVQLHGFADNYQIAAMGSNNGWLGIP